MSMTNLMRSWTKGGERIRYDARAFLGVLALVLLCIQLGCASPPAGPAFVAAAAPPDHRTRVYIYRADPRASLARVDIEIDGRPIGRFQNNEYESIELAAGPHLLKARMRGLAFVSMGWNQHPFRALPGDSVYIEVSVRLDARTIPASPSLEIAGRSSAGGSENVFLIERGETEAREHLRGTTRIIPPE
ncbi:MAG: hypothetical protein AB8G23_18530 [Myxococcota bacterium]